jgi:hypothetical protein
MLSTALCKDCVLGLNGAKSMDDYKELPCRRCGRVWKWSFDKKSVPYCPEGYGCTKEGPTVKEMFDEVMKRLDDIEMKINRILPVQPVYPTTPAKPSLGGVTCAKCGLRWEGAMAYSCFLSDCPVQIKVTSQTYNTSDFNIESPDPDQRTWYYDRRWNEEEKRMKFIKSDRYANQDRVKIEMEVHDESSLDEILEEFQNFLRACGYVIEYDQHLGLISDDS